MKQKICAAVLSAAMLICAYGTAVFASTDNIALNAQCTTNSQNGQHVAGRAVDGNLSTRWQAIWKETAPWIIIDLGEEKTFNKISLTTTVPQYLTSYKVEAADDADFTVNAVNVTDGVGSAAQTVYKNLFSAVNKRYVKVSFVTPNGLAISEIELYNTDIVSIAVDDEYQGVAAPYTTGSDGKYDDITDAYPEGWTNGFYPGMLWLLYAQTGQDSYREYAQKIEEKLEKMFLKASSLHHDMGFIWMNSAVKDYDLTGNAQSRERALLAAYVLASRYNIKGRFIRAWNGEMQTGTGIIDCMMNIPLLYWASEQEHDPRFAYIADSFAHTVMNSHIRADGSVNHIVSYDIETGEVIKAYGGQGYADGSSWSRGQAWAIHGFAQCYGKTGNDEYLQISKRVANYFIASIGSNYIPRCDFRQPAEPDIIDTTAGTVAASAFISLAEYTPENERQMYLDAACNILSAYDKNICNWSEDSEELVPYGTEAYHKESGIHIPIIYGDYYFIEAVCKLKQYYETGKAGDGLGEFRQR